MEERLCLEVFYDYICPWCYLGTLNTERLVREYGIELRWTLFPLHPEIPVEGMELADLFPGRPLGAMKGKLKEAAAAAGLPLARRSRISSSRRAQELEKWAVSLGKGDEFRGAAFRVYFADGRDIALIPVLEEIAEAAGLERGEVRTVLEQRLFANAVDADWLRAREFAITAVPFYLYGEEPLVGYRPYEDFVKLIGKG
jgi:predicted DsbA family dithiol-disulfide isomerase